jgi:hypothetical protein
VTWHDYVGFTLGALGAIAFFVGILWTCGAVWKAGGWWRLLLALVPTYLVLQWFLAMWIPFLRRPLWAYVASFILVLGGDVFLGDLIWDKHPDVKGRTFWVRLAGCVEPPVNRLFDERAKSPATAWLRGFTFDASIAGYETTNALAAARASMLAYEDSAMVHSIANGWGFSRHRVHPLSVKNHTAFVLANDSFILVAFRGTNDRKDIWDDSNIWPVDIGIGNVHRGFRQAAQTLWPKVLQTTTQVRDRNQPVWLTGHSLGGAIAVLTALRMQEERIEVAGIYTFGQPRVGDQAFVDHTRRVLPAYFRVVNHVDAVPTLPPGWKHSGDLMYFDTAGRLHPGGCDSAQTSMDIKTAAIFYGFEQAEAHDIRLYVGHLEQLDAMR